MQERGNTIRPDYSPQREEDGDEGFRWRQSASGPGGIVSVLPLVVSLLHAKASEVTHRIDSELRQARDSILQDQDFQHLHHVLWQRDEEKRREHSVGSLSDGSSTPGQRESVTEGSPLLSDVVRENRQAGARKRRKRPLSSLSFPPLLPCPLSRSQVSSTGDSLSLSRVVVTPRATYPLRYCFQTFVFIHLLLQPSPQHPFYLVFALSRARALSLLLSPSLTPPLYVLLSSSC